MLLWACFIFLLVRVEELFAVKNLLQSGAHVRYCNEEYMTNCTAITRRVRRGEPYRTNFTGTTLHTWNNNVTMQFTLNRDKYGDAMSIKGKICEIMKVNWFKDYMKTYSNMPMTCPIPANHYTLLNIEFPPKGFPLPMPKGDMDLRVSVEVTDTKLQIAEFFIRLHGD